MHVGVDFTHSNGDPNEPGTLHYYTEEVQSPYAQAIESVVGILQDYDR